MAVDTWDASGAPKLRRAYVMLAKFVADEGCRSQRYDVNFWGKKGGRRAPGKRPGKQQANQQAAANAADDRLLEETRRNNNWELGRCRELLLELDEDDLRDRLEASRWNSGGSALG
jgi:hypothetical protein